MFAGDLTTAKGRAWAWSDSLFVDHAVFRTVWHNLAPVVPGELYRSNHPTPSFLAHVTARLQIRTLINLRGARRCGSDALSREAAARLRLVHIDAPFESRGPPHRERVLRLAEIYKTMQTPALMHCKSGADRAGLAAGLYVLLNGGTAAQALEQLSWRFGHFNRSRTGILDAFFMRYAREAEGRIDFLDWVTNEYNEADLRRDFVASGKLSTFITDHVLNRE
jgi:protein tyrosine/serine phosphatase